MPRGVVPDTAGIPTRRAVEAARPPLAELGIYLYYRPAYRPALNRVAPVARPVTRHDVPVRGFTRKADPRKAVEGGFDTYRHRLTGKGDNGPRP